MPGTGDTQVGREAQERRRQEAEVRTHKDLEL
jgi:hypothetical protein